MKKEEGIMQVFHQFQRNIIPALILGLALSGAAWGQSLKTVPVPEPPNLANFVRDRAAAIQLGKALFWDMQVGSDGITACASCHFHAGADSRNKGQLNPDTLGGDSTFQAGGRNTALGRGKFPFVKFVNPDNPSQGVLRDWNDVVSSQGVRLRQFVDIVPGVAEDLGTTLADPVFRGFRRVEPRNTPSVINAVFNFANFWDGRANNVFNGANPFGAMDADAAGNPNKRIMANTSGGLVPVVIRIRNGSLASQAVGPPTSDFEMSWRGRTWPKIGKKMLSLAPLAKQIVHPQDSVLGPLSKSTLVNGVPTNVKGINTTYTALIKKAFLTRFWNSTTQIVTFDANGLPTAQPRPGTPLTTNQYTQMEANFSLFFGLAIQLYEATLIADDTPFDRFQEGFLSALTPTQQFGMQIFQGNGQCVVCHEGPEMTGAAVGNVLPDPNPPPPGQVPINDPRKNPLNAIELMPFTIGEAIYDVDFVKISVVRTANDPGRGGTAPFVNPLTGAQYPLSWSILGQLKRDGLLPASVAAFTPSLPVGFQADFTRPTPDRAVNGGGMKVPQLRNVDLTGPYFHNGGAATLMQVVDFYSRGGNFRVGNFPDVTAEDDGDIPVEISPIGFLRGSTVNQAALVAFLQGLTDPRVKEERAPFDHPQLFIPQGTDATLTDIINEIPAVGAGGRIPAGLLPLLPFLNVNQFSP
jgi:cytochrome c peroxidase